MNRLNTIWLLGIALFSLSFLLPGDKPTPLQKTVYHRLGDRTLTLVSTQFGKNNDWGFVHLHDDEQTALEATRSLLTREGGQLVRLSNWNKRFVRFRVHGKFYSFDPNGMFTREGVERSLRLLGRYHPDAAREAVELGQRFLQLLPDSIQGIISLHNNTPGYFSVLSYAAGGDKAREAKAVYVNPTEDPDDFFLVTQEAHFQKIKARGYNCVWQDNEGCTDDGSLSVYCGKKGIPYINCETEHGKVSKYREMMEWLMANGR